MKIKKKILQSMHFTYVMFTETKKKHYLVRITGSEYIRNANKKFRFWDKFDKQCFQKGKKKIFLKWK